MSMKYRKCLMGCPVGENKLHSFPKDPTRRAEWLRILDIKTAVKIPFICRLHFTPENFFGKKMSKYALPKSTVKAVLNISSNSNIEVTETAPSPNNSHISQSSSDLQENFNLEGNAIDDQKFVINLEEELKEDQEKEVLVAEGLNNSEINDSSSQIAALKLALDHCGKQLSEEKSKIHKLWKENTRLSQELDKYKKLSANLGSESCELKKHILREVVQFLTEQEEKEEVDKKSIYMIRNSGRYCDVNLINM